MPNKTPAHIGIIMDGNRRWATQHGVTTLEGHRAGYRALKALLPVFKQMGIKYLTVYAFSAENWSRSKTEVKGLLGLLKWVFKHELSEFMKNEVRIRIIGSLDGLSADIVKVLNDAEQKTQSNKAGTLGVCFNYGGQAEIVDAAKKLIEQGIVAAQVTAEKFAQALYAPDIPPIDLLIRTGGEQRLSGFMLWRSDYAELYFTDKYWPDFGVADLKTAVADYASRQRRYGK